MSTRVTVALTTLLAAGSVAPHVRAQPAPGSTTAQSPDERWTRAAVSGADTIVRARVVDPRARHPDAGDSVEVEVLERLHGPLTPRRIFLHEMTAAMRARLRAGATFYVAAANVQGGSPGRVPLALFDDTAAERARLEALIVPGWRSANVVLVAHAVPAPDASQEYRGRLVFAVERVLRGAYEAPRVTVFGSNEALFDAPSAGTGRWVLSLHRADVPPAGSEQVAALEDYARVDDSNVARVAAEIARTPSRGAEMQRAADALRELHVAWNFHRAESVAEVSVERREVLTANCDVTEVTLTVRRWLRGSGPAGAVFARERVNGCHPGPLGRGGRARDETGVAARDARGSVLAFLEADAPSLARVQRWVDAPSPWYAGGGSAAPAGDEPLRVAAPLESLPEEWPAGLSWVRVEAAVPATTPGPMSPPELRLRPVAHGLGGFAANTGPLVDPARAPAYFSARGAGLPPVVPGRRYWIAVLDRDAERLGARPLAGSGPTERWLMLPDTLVPDEAGPALMALRYASRRFALPRP